MERCKVPYGKTISTKIDKELTEEFDRLAKLNGHTKQVIIRHAVLAYIKQYTDKEDMVNYVDNIQYE
jgi:predicted DNA-binding protein